MQRDPTIVSIQAGVPREIDADAAGRAAGPWTSAIFKTPLEGPARLMESGIEGDQQADPVNHGGPDKAVCVYSADHYPDWAQVLSQPLQPGAFGENFTLSGLSESDVCIGDLWSAGDVILQVSQPRQPCWKLARKWRIDRLPRLIIESGRTGWYFRVVRGGYVARGTTLSLRERTAPGWTIAAANDVMHGMPFDTVRARDLMAVAGLSASWKESLRRKAEAAL